MFSRVSLPGSVTGSSSGLSGLALAMLLVPPMLVVHLLVLAQRVQQMPLVPAQGAVQQFVAACAYPTVR